MARTRIKICGITDEEGLFAAADAGADAVGFVFHPKSRRFVEPEEAFELTAFLPPFVSSVALFVDATVEKYMEMEEACPTTLSQLHGQESEEVVRACGPGVIKAVRYDAGTIERELRRWDAVDEVDAVLVDGSTGGEGLAFDWSGLAAVRGVLNKPLILAGGLTAKNVAEAIRVVRPFAVDVSSGVERDGEPGRKDPRLVEAFCRAVREGDIG